MLVNNLLGRGQKALLQSTCLACNDMLGMLKSSMKFETRSWNWGDSCRETHAAALKGHCCRCHSVVGTKLLGVCEMIKSRVHHSQLNGGLPHGLHGFS